jgi:isopenicillin N synthase-like dioxygenase
MDDFDEIPVLDISALHRTDGTALVTLARQIRDVYATTGFGYIIGHGIDQGLIDAVFAASAQFHALPHAQKMQITLDENHRGFIPINTSTDVTTTLADVTRPNQSESFMMMREDLRVDPAAYLSGPNQWPDLDGFRATVTAYHDAMTDLGRKLVRVFAMALDAAETDFGTAFDTPTTWLRLLYYPTTDAADGDDLYGSAPHSDFGFLTFLAQDDVGGLQVQTPSGAWVDAPKIDGSFVLNVGDMLHRWSGGILKSTPHRVINRSGRARYSCPFFFDPHVSANIAPLASCDSGANYAPINFGDFLRSELEAGYDAHKTDAP